MDNLTIGIAFIAGLLSFLSPCVLPLVPAYVGYMGGRMTRTVALQTNAKVKTDGTVVIAQRANMVLHGIVFVLGFTLVFVTIGLMTTVFRSALSSTATSLKDIIPRIGGVLIIFFGLHFMGAIRWFFRSAKTHRERLNSPLVTLIIGVLLSLLVYWSVLETLLIALPLWAGIWLWLFLGNGVTQPQAFWLGFISNIETALYSDTRREMNPKQQQGLWGSFSMGIVFSAGWTPCIGPIYGAILTLASENTLAVSTSLLIAYSLGLGIPFILATLLLDRVQGVLRRLQKHIHKLELVSGTMMVIIGLALASGEMTRLSTYLSGSFADFTVRVEECGVGYFQGELGFNQVGSCLGGSLVPLSLKQSATSQLSEQVPSMQFVVHIAPDESIDVELSKIAPDFMPTITLQDANGNRIAESSTLTAIDDEKYIALANISVPQDGLYTVTVSDTQGDFRIKIRRAETSVSATPQETAPTIDTAETDSNSPVIGIANTGTISGFGGATASDSPAVMGLNVGNLAPDFSVITIDGETIRLSELQGKVVLINFWGTWCGPCRREMPDLQALYAQYGDLDFVIVALAVRDKQEAVEAFREEFGITFDLALDEQNTVTNLYGVTGQPSTFVINRDGTIASRYYSVISEDDLAPVLETALAQ
jgi:cytochrome c biogenesis protein CcdA/peroxiredoxin